MMPTDKRIKIIKRSERHERQAAPSENSSAHIRDSTAGTKRAAVTIVAGWVQELRRKKVAEAARGFDSLFDQSTAGTTRG